MVKGVKIVIVTKTPGVDNSDTRVYNTRLNQSLYNLNFDVICGKTSIEFSELTLI